MLTVALTSLLLLVVDPDSATAESDSTPPTPSASSQPHAAPSEAAEPDAVQVEPGVQHADEVAKAATHEARRAFTEIERAALGNLPKFMLALALLVLAWALTRTLRFLLRRVMGKWPRSTAVVALSGVTVWVLAAALAVTIIAGDVRAFLGSVGLLGLAASWALQTPIESFTGWLLNAFRSYYRVGDRVEVGDIFGDVHRIDVLTTTVWEIGSPFRPGFVRAEQPTGRLITFPNNQILTGSVMNLTRDFAFVWDELSVAVANESDLRYAVEVIERAANELLGATMKDAASQYEAILKRARLEDSVPRAPEVFVSVEDSWTNLQIRYLVHAKQRRGTKSNLILMLSDVLNHPEHAERIVPVISRQQLQLIGADGRAKNAAWFEPFAPVKE